MAKDYFTSRGLNTTQMMATALKYRNEFDMLHVELVDIVDIIEFRLIETFPEFRLVIARDAQMDEDALAEPLKNRITVRQSVYVAACDGDAKARLILAHELGHFLLHREKNAPMHKDPRGAVQNIRKMTATESIEDQADMFARHFLAPPHLAYRYREEPLGLAKATGVPLHICMGNIRMSKRPEVYPLRNRNDENTGPRPTSGRSFYNPCDAGIQRCSSSPTDDR